MSTSAIVLAGGDARRFGTDKARARWTGRRLVDHVVAVLRPLSEKIILVTQAERRAESWPADQVVCDDPTLPAGPLRGLVRGLVACHGTHAWVVACDAPRLQSELLLALRRECRPQDLAVLPVWEGRPQPLVACYAAAAAEPLAELLADGEHSPLRALATLGYRALPEKRCRQLDPEGLSFINVNSPADLERLMSPPSG